MPVEQLRGGLKVTGTNLWLDARKQSPLSFVSHAHSDHIARHQQVIATDATLRLMEHRLGPLASKLAVAYRQPVTLDGLRLELFSAGHVLGSAQLRVTRADGHRIVYTGDFSLEPMLTAAPAEIPECDTVVIESTFGEPRFRFPPRDAVFDQVESWARAQLARGVRPILYAYSLGKSQEAIAQLNRRGLKAAVHPSIDDVSEVYRQLGVDVQARRFDGQFEEGEVGIFPPFGGKSQALKQVGARATAVLTGWALEGWAARRYAADVAFPVSDHADYDALVRFARESKAREVITHHGFSKELSAALRKEGIFSRALSEKVQLDLFHQAAPVPQRRSR